MKPQALLARHDLLKLLQPRLCIRSVTPVEIEEHRSFEVAAVMGEGVEAGLTVVAAHAAVADSAEGQA